MYLQQFGVSPAPHQARQGVCPLYCQNLKLREIPSCFFALVEGASSRSGDRFEDFAALVEQAASGKTK